ncbi:hypothetical protein [Stenotrophomonas sp. PS02289]|uniref:SpaN/EivJ family type III secretion system needle length determinant n=1 Tax=Stenotrophomonas sp. PS02289 TaxID=2991422 RepID=UPI00249CA018|nr:hypothetical protein [Stenotrophomonas sp. PS02289]
MSLTIQNAAAAKTVNALEPVKPLAKRMEQERNNAMSADDSATPPRGAEDGVHEPEQDLPAWDTDPDAPDQDEDKACGRSDNARSDASSDPADVFIERVVTGPRTGEAMLAMRLSPVSVPAVPTPPENAQPSAANPAAATPVTEGDAPTTAKPGHPLNSAPPSAATPSSAGLQTPLAAVKSPLSSGAPAPGTVLQGAAQPARAPHASTSTTDGVVGNGRAATSPASAPAHTGADSSLDPEAPRAPATETAGAAGRQESNTVPLPALAAQDAANRHSADAAAGQAGQTRSDANIDSQRNLQHVQQALKTAEVLAQRASAGTRMDVAFTSWGPGNSVSLSRQLGGHWTATPSNARVGQALGSNTPNDLEVRREGDNLRVEESSMTDPDGRRQQQREHDTP